MMNNNECILVLFSNQQKAVTGYLLNWRSMMNNNECILVLFSNQQKAVTGYLSWLKKISSKRY
ncbi:hypothetical protein TSAR_015315 [Trichomalopsis sarcophagae]|uniref:Uncharacterized protein n=1 Tax=Trichomalopsis sarcophagae TaxID=543379 RepID=A0A232EDI4_9HYME|nr:hypothetical protein TSAR_015315 [Trichomalopsis sarcophagae]